ncbi:MAG TPA: hypothetical protein VMT54_00275 [Candidatus Cybelea sp.]|nr:hypothetical protein [Candidatus Cybelea sp.]
MTRQHDRHKPTEPAPSPKVEAEGALRDAALDRATGGTEKMLSNVMKAQSDTQNDLASNMKA